MRTEIAADTTETPAAKQQKTATITLHAADGSQMQIVAERQGEAARTYVIVTKDKKSSRGLTAQHPSWDAAVTSTAATAKSAVKLGWTRREAGKRFAPKPDAFATLPPAPKAGKK